MIEGQDLFDTAKISERGWGDFQVVIADLFFRIILLSLDFKI